MTARSLIAPLAFVLLAACDLSTEPEKHFPGLATQYWTAESVDGHALPRVIAQRQLEGGILEYDILDGLHLEVDTAGTWQQRAFVRRFRDGELHAALEVESQGTWAAEPSGYVFGTDQSEEAFIIRQTFTESFTTSMRIKDVTQGVQVKMVKALM